MKVPGRGSSVCTSAAFGIWCVRGGVGGEGEGEGDVGGEGVWVGECEARGEVGADEDGAEGEEPLGGGVDGGVLGEEVDAGDDRLSAPRRAGRCSAQPARPHSTPHSAHTAPQSHLSRSETLVQCSSTTLSRASEAANVLKLIPWDGWRGKRGERACAVMGTGRTHEILAVSCVLSKSDLDGDVLGGVERDLLQGTECNHQLFWLGVRRWRLQVKSEGVMPEVERGLVTASDPEGRRETVPEGNEVDSDAGVCVPSAR